MNDDLIERIKALNIHQKELVSKLIDEITSDTSETGFLLSYHFLLKKIHYFSNRIIFLNAFYVFPTLFMLLNPICKKLVLFNLISVSFFHVSFT